MKQEQVVGSGIDAGQRYTGSGPRNMHLVDYRFHESSSIYLLNRFFRPADAVNRIHRMCSCLLQVPRVVLPGATLGSPVVADDPEGVRLTVIMQVHA